MVRRSQGCRPARRRGAYKVHTPSKPASTKSEADHSSENMKEDLEIGKSFFDRLKHISIIVFSVNTAMIVALFRYPHSEGYVSIIAFGIFISSLLFLKCMRETIKAYDAVNLKDKEMYKKQMRKSFTSLEILTYTSVIAFEAVSLDFICKCIVTNVDNLKNYLSWSWNGILLIIDLIKDWIS